MNKTIKLGSAARFKPLKIAILFATALTVLAITDVSAERTFTVNGKTVERNIYTAAVLVNEASALMHENNIDRAVGKLKKALSYAPNFSPAHSQLGVLLARQGKNQEALEHLKKSLEGADVPAVAFLNLASFYQTNGDLDGAISTYKRYMELDSSDAASVEQSRVTLSLLERERDRRAEAKSGLVMDTRNYFTKEQGNLINHWTDWHMPLKVYIAPTDNIEGFPSQYDALLRQSFYDWEKASNDKIKFRFVENKNDSDIDCFWTNNAEEVGNGVENGFTVTKTRLGTIAHSHIALRAKEQEGNFPFTANTIFTTCRHEIGHALGIMWHSPNPADLMYFTTPTADIEKTITERDRNTLKELYAQSIAPTGLAIDFLTYKGNFGKLVPLCLIFVGLIVAALRMVQNSKDKKRKKKA